MGKENFKTAEVETGLWVIDDGEMRCFLVIGEERALLFDTGAINGVKIEAHKITKLPLIAVNSHAHPDHTAGNKDFDMLYASASTRERLPLLPPICVLKDGDCIDLGGHSLLAVVAPGHTAGDLVLIEQKAGWVLSGDVIQDRPICLDGEDSDIFSYRNSLERLLEMVGEEFRFYPAHGSMPLESLYLSKVLRCVNEYLLGDRQTHPAHVVLPGVDVWTNAYQNEDTTLYVRHSK